MLVLVPPVLIALFQLWESYQVELCGSYSVARLQEFTTYYRQTSLLQALGLTLLTPLPCILSIVLADVWPLKQPSKGVAGQGTVYWIRTFYSVILVTATSLSQFYHSSSRLSLRVSSALILTLVVTVATVVLILGLHLIIGFPTPFLYQSISGFWMVLLFSSMWVLWKATIRTDATAQADLRRFAWCWFCQVAMIIVYPIFSYVFSTLSSRLQTFFSLLLPFWKLGLKIWASYGVFRLEDAAPVFVVFTVDVFHALFLSCAMQSSSSTGSATLVSVMLIDFFQSCVAVNYVRVISARLWRLGAVIDGKEVKAAASQSSSSSSLSTTVPSNILARASDIVASHPTIRDHPSIAGSRHDRVAGNAVNAVRSGRDNQTPHAKLPRSARVYVAAEPVDHHSDGLSTDCNTNVAALDEERLQFARDTLRLLHMVEFYMLIEYTEVLVATIYSVYLVIMSHLPNRTYYQQLRSMTTYQWRATVTHVVTYAGLELLSFTVLALVFRRLLGYSPTRQVAFALRTHWRLVQSLLVLWVFFAIQMSLEHLGCDYTFKFAWLHRSGPPQTIATQNNAADSSL